MNRFFRTADASLYEQVRATLDQAWGHVPPKTCIDPADVAPRDRQGRILLAVRAEFTTYSVAVDVLPQLLASGAVQEISEAEYWASMPPPPAE